MRALPTRARLDDLLTCAALVDYAPPASEPYTFLLAFDRRPDWGHTLVVRPTAVRGAGLRLQRVLCDVGGHFLRSSVAAMDVCKVCPSITDHDACAIPRLTPRLAAGSVVRPRARGHTRCPACGRSIVRCAHVPACLAARSLAMTVATLPECTFEKRREQEPGTCAMPRRINS